MSRIQRLIKRLAGRSFDYQGLRKATSIDQSVAWNRQRPIEMFNGNVLRAKVVQGIIEAVPCNNLYETGTYHGATAIGAQRYLRLPVWSCEVNPRNYLISRIVTFNMPNIFIFRDDSRNFLHRVCSHLQTVPEARPFFYLDAHENELDTNSLPLKEEIQIIFSLNEFVVMIDDFRIPLMDSFEARMYAGVVIEIKLIKDILTHSRIKTCYFPAYHSSQDTGYPCGYCVFWRSEKLDSLMKSSLFPLNLLRPYAITEEVYLENNTGL